jgi:hypothetical protein
MVILLLLLLLLRLRFIHIVIPYKWEKPLVPSSHCSENKPKERVVPRAEQSIWRETQQPTWAVPTTGKKRKLIFIHVDDKWTRPSSTNPTPRQSCCDWDDVITKLFWRGHPSSVDQSVILPHRHADVDPTSILFSVF